ncbi:hypothetical protein ABEB36_010465 [Hypothenemus hampei]|uniref:Uncharacterized protein n=1 Tax=Hypothenemus hampei TaxID=57062 RepID=A0ABD1EK13_HYPHA
MNTKVHPKPFIKLATFRNFVMYSISKTSNGASRWDTLHGKPQFLEDTAPTMALNVGEGNYADILSVYGYCNGNSVEAVREIGNNISRSLEFIPQRFCKRLGRWQRRPKKSQQSEPNQINSTNLLKNSHLEQFHLHPRDQDSFVMFSRPFFDKSEEDLEEKCKITMNCIDDM